MYIFYSIYTINPPPLPPLIHICLSYKLFKFFIIFSHELNVSVQQSGFTITRKYKPMPGDHLKLKFGDLIRFYHKEMEAYLVAEGLFDDEICEDGKF